MKTITREMIKTYRIKKCGYDFMGYTYKNINDLSFHHLIIPKRCCKEAGLGEGYLIWNGAILNQNTSHDYLHLIEKIDREAFIKITNFMILENEMGSLDLEILKEIRNILLIFEKQYKKERKANGQLLIKESYITQRIKL